jgi:hypothetical protein
MPFRGNRDQGRAGADHVVAPADARIRPLRDCRRSEGVVSYGMVQRSWLAVVVVAVSAVGLAAADSNAPRDHTRALGTQLIEAARSSSTAKLTALLEVPLRYSVLAWDDEKCGETFHTEGTVTRATLRAFAACLAKQDLAGCKMLVDDEPLDTIASSLYVRFKTGPTGRRLINAIEFGVVDQTPLRKFTGILSPDRKSGIGASAPGTVASARGTMAPAPGTVTADFASSGGGPRAVMVRFSEPSGDFGGLLAEEIERVVKARAGLFRACYQRELNHTPGLSGKLIVHFKIGGDGIVQSRDTLTTGASTLRNDAVELCVQGNVNRLKFPARGGVANLSYAFVFTNGDPAAPPVAGEPARAAAPGAPDALDAGAPATARLPESLDRGMIADGVLKLRPRAMACAEKWPAKGQVKVSLTVAPDGHVVSVRVMATPDAGLGSCVAGVMQQATFATTRDGGSFGYPFIF